MESQQPLGVDLVLLVQQLLLLSGQTKAVQALEKDRYTMDCLYSQGGCRVAHVSLALASMKQHYTQLYWCCKSGSNVVTITLWRPDHTDMSSLTFTEMVVGCQLHLGLHLRLIGVKHKQLGLATYQLDLVLVTVTVDLGQVQEGHSTC